MDDPRLQLFKEQLANNRPTIVNAVKGVFNSFLDKIIIVPNDTSTSLRISFPNNPNGATSQLIDTLAYSFGLRGWVQMFQALEANNQQAIRRLLIGDEPFEGE